MGVVFDTGSSNLWVPNVNVNAKGKHVYNEKKSSTYTADGRKFQIMYGSGPVAGYYSKMMQTLGAQQTQQGLFVASCSSTAKVSFTLGGSMRPRSGTSFDLTVEDMTIQRQGDTCLLGVKPGPQGAPWILGDVFMRKYYITHDWGNKRLGFATSVNSADLSSEKSADSTVVV